MDLLKVHAQKKLSELNSSLFPIWPPKSYPKSPNHLFLFYGPISLLGLYSQPSPISLPLSASLLLSLCKALDLSRTTGASKLGDWALRHVSDLRPSGLRRNPSGKNSELQLRFRCFSCAFERFGSSCSSFFNQPCLLWRIPEFYVNWAFRGLNFVFCSVILL